MNWTVFYSARAEQELTATWLAAVDRHAMTIAANKIDRLLAADPESVGQVLFDTVSSVEVSPLIVEFEVVGEDRLVWVLGVRDSTLSLPP